MFKSRQITWLTAWFSKSKILLSQWCHQQSPQNCNSPCIVFISFTTSTYPSSSIFIFFVVLLSFVKNTVIEKSWHQGHWAFERFWGTSGRLQKKYVLLIWVGYLSVPTQYSKRRQELCLSKIGGCLVGLFLLSSMVHFHVFCFLSEWLECQWMGLLWSSAVWQRRATHLLP